MVKTYSLILLAATMTLSLLAAPAVLAGPGGTAYNGPSVIWDHPVSPVLVQDPAGHGDASLYTYRHFGSVADFGNGWTCADWNGDGMNTSAAFVTEGGDGAMLWAFDWDGLRYDAVGRGPGATCCTDIKYRRFGTFATDRAAPGNWNTEMDQFGAVHKGVEVGVVRDEGDDLVWYIEDFPASPLPTCENCSRYVFGPAGADPAQGNWDGDPNTPWQLGYTTINEAGAKEWTIQTLPPADAGPEDFVVLGTFGAGTDGNYQNNVLNDGVTLWQISRTTGCGDACNVFITQGADDMVTARILGSNANSTPVNCMGL